MSARLFLHQTLCYIYGKSVLPGIPGMIVLIPQGFRMLISHEGKSPSVHPSAYIAPNAVLCGDVSIGPGCRVLFGAQVIAEGGAIVIGAECIIMENAVLRSNVRHSLNIGNNCLVGPNAHVVGCMVEDEVFIATGASIFHGARLGKGCEVRINGVVHIKTHVPPGETVPIGWVAVGAPASILPPDQHEKIWKIQEPLNFPLTVYGFERAEADMRKITRRLSEKLGAHKDDEIQA
jgi:carbonic anhydrase/acetyltransferase-like protein (isoleucine patch superfamily)